MKMKITFYLVTAKKSKKIQNLSTQNKPRFFAQNDTTI